ncbi:unnamed protein product [Phaeothamnion confervicola]
MASGIINIAGLEKVDDPEYRYKMPRVIGKVEGRGNGIKTVIANVVDLSISLKRDPGEITKFFGCELGAQTTWRPETERAIVNGAHTDAALQQLVHKYIELFVICPQCRLPESSYKIRHGIINHKCAACGCKDVVDMTHKLCTFILNQEKKAKSERAKDKAAKKEKESSGDKKDKKEKGEKKDKKSKKDKEGEAGAEPAAADDAKKSKKSDDGFGSDEDEAPTLDNVCADDAGAFADSVAAVRRHISDRASPEKLAEEIRTAQTFAAFPVYQRLHIYIAARFVGAAAITQPDIGEIAPVLRLIRPGISLRDDQRHLIGAFELLCASQQPQLLPCFVTTLKFLYDLDLLEEEAVMAWAAAPRDPAAFTSPAVSGEQVAALKQRAAPFVTWLKEAEVEGGEEDDDEDDEEED